MRGMWTIILPLLLLTDSFHCSAFVSLLERSRPRIPLTNNYHHFSETTQLRRCRRRHHAIPFHLYSAATTSLAEPSNKTDAVVSSSSSATSSSSSSSSPTDLNELNLALHRLAEQVSGTKSDDNLHVIARAAACEQTWKTFQEGTGGCGDVVSLNTVLRAWNQCAHSLAENRDTKKRQQGNKVNLSKMAADTTLVIPPVYTAHDAAQRALDILNQHEEESTTTTIIPDITSYNIVMDALAKCHSSSAPKEVTTLMDRLLSLDDEDRQLKPDLLSWSYLIDAYAYSNEKDRLQKIESSWKRMQKLHKNDPEKYVRPTVKIVNSILHAYAHTPSISSSSSSSSSSSVNPKQERQAKIEEAQENAKECLRIFSNLRETYQVSQDPNDQPDASTYTTVIHALSRAGTLSYTERAQSLFDELQELYMMGGRDERFQPTVNTYTAMILAWARTPAKQSANRADELLHQILEKAQHDTTLRPNVKCFTATIQAWTRSRHVQKAARALQLLQQMKALSSKYPNVAPTLVAYGAAVEACSRTKGTVEQETSALKIAFAILKAIERDGLQANNVVYASVLRATASLMVQGDERNSIAKAVFGKAVAAGQVDQSVIRALQKASDASIQHEILAQMTDQHGCILYDGIPPAWSKNVWT